MIPIKYTQIDKTKRFGNHDVVIMGIEILKGECPAPPRGRVKLVNKAINKPGLKPAPATNNPKVEQQNPVMDD